MGKPLFFFGAGADSVYNIVKQNSFRKPLLLHSQYESQRKALIGKSCNAQFIRSTTKKIYLQTIYEYQEEARFYLGDVIVDDCLQHRSFTGKKTDKSVGDRIEKYVETWYSKLSSPETYADAEKDEKQLDKDVQFFLKYIVFFDALDEKFNSLRYASKKNYTAQRVINAYFTLFIEMLYGLYNIDDSFDWSMKSVLNLLNSDYTKPNIPEDDCSYYTILKKHFCNGDDNDIQSACYIATTNYTELVRQYSGHNDVIYLHGKMTWFEDYKRLAVYDCTKENERQCIIENRDSILPFILIPSGVKPLICKKQVDEFYKFGQALWDEQTRVAVVVGYRFNSEDNHINSMFSEWLRKGDRTLIVLDYNGEIRWDRLHWADDLRNNDFFDTIAHFDYEDFKHRSNKWKPGILDIHVQDDSYDVFKTILNELELQEEQK